MPSMSDTKVNFIRLWMLTKSLGWNVSIVSKEAGSDLGDYHSFKYEYSEDVTVRAHVFDNGLSGPEVGIYSRQHGTLLVVRALCLEHTVSAVEEVLAWADETSPCS